MPYIDEKNFFNSFSYIAERVNQALSTILSEPLKSIDKLKISECYKEILKNLYTYDYTFIVERPGKRLRPFILITVARGNGYKDLESLLQPACAVEIFHNSTLVHDDIVDRDDIRSGRPTVRKLWSDFYSRRKDFLGRGEKPVEKGDYTAIQSGDRLLLLPYHLLSTSNFRPDQKTKAVSILATRAQEIAEGQLLDLSFEGRKDTTLKDVLYMYTKKTGALFEACALIGLTLSDGKEYQKKALSKWAREYFNWRFQIKDDLIENNIDGVKGRPVGSDIKDGKVTPLVVATLEMGSREEKKAFLRAWGNKRATEEEIHSAIDAAFSSGAVDRLRKMIEEFGEKGKALIERACLEKEYEDLLKDLTEYVGARTY